MYVHSFLNFILESFLFLLFRELRSCEEIIENIKKLLNNCMSDLVQKSNDCTCKYIANV